MTMKINTQKKAERKKGKEREKKGYRKKAKTERERKRMMKERTRKMRILLPEKSTILGNVVFAVVINTRQQGPATQDGQTSLRLNFISGVTVI